MNQSITAISYFPAAAAAAAEREDTQKKRDPHTNDQNEAHMIACMHASSNPEEEIHTRLVRTRIVLAKSLNRYYVHTKKYSSKVESRDADSSKHEYILRTIGHILDNNNNNNNNNTLLEK
jgi:hypothetical protein